MLNSAILDVVIAVIFTFLAISLLTGAVVEAIASVLKLRSSTLKTGVMDLLNDPNFSDLAKAIYAHALVNPRGSGGPARLTSPPPPAPPPAAPGLLMRVRNQAAVLGQDARTALPAYIDPKLFAKAFCDVLTFNPTMDLATLQATVNTQLPAANYPQINQLLTGVINRTGADLSLIHQELATWFDNAMDRVSGVYKRYTQLLTFILALLISVLANANPFLVGQRVWAQPALIDQVKAAPPASDLSDAWALAESLPIGWAQSFGKITDKSGEVIELHGPGWAYAIFGWLITAIATLFGAPFWFDTLQQVIRLKGSGPSPQEKADDTAAAA